MGKSHNYRKFRQLRAIPVISAALLLISCATAAPPGIRAETVEVVREVQRPCPVTKPVRPKPIGALPTDLQALAAVLGGKLLEWAGPGGYGDRAEAAIDTCTRP